MSKTVDYGEVKRSIRDLTRIYRPSNAFQFVKDFVRKYNVAKGYEDELVVIVQNELTKMSKK